MGDLVMRLETAAAKQDQKVREKFDYDAAAADLRELLLEAARRIKRLESREFDIDDEFAFANKVARGENVCGND